MGIFAKKEALKVKPSAVKAQSGTPAPHPASALPPLPPAIAQPAGNIGIAPEHHKIELPPLPPDLLPPQNTVPVIPQQVTNSAGYSPYPQNPATPAPNLAQSMPGGANNPVQGMPVMPSFGGIPPGMPQVSAANPSNPNASPAPQNSPMGNNPDNNSGMYPPATPVPAEPEHAMVDVRTFEMNEIQKELRRRISTVKGPVFISLERYHEVKDLLHSLRENSRGLRAKVEELKDNKSTGNDLLKSTVDNLEQIEEEIENINSTLRV